MGDGQHSFPGHLDWSHFVQMADPHWDAFYCSCVAIKPISFLASGSEEGSHTGCKTPTLLNVIIIVIELI